MKHSKYCQTFDKILWNKVLQVWKENIKGIKESKIIIIGIKKDWICQGKRLKGNKEHIIVLKRKMENINDESDSFLALLIETYKSLYFEKKTLNRRLRLGKTWESNKILKLMKRSQNSLSGKKVLIVSVCMLSTIYGPFLISLLFW